MAKFCPVCKKDIGVFTGKVKLKDGEYVCTKCWGKAGFNTWGDLTDKPLIYTAQDIINIVDDITSANVIISTFAPTSDIGPAAKFNDTTKQMILANHMFAYAGINSYKKFPEHYSLFNYDQIVDFEILENGSSIASGGLGRAAIGGILFGGVGAVVGASTRSFKGNCEELKIKVTVNNYKSPAFYIPLINSSTSKTSKEYKEKMKMAQDTLSKLQLITNMLSAPNNAKTPTADNKFEEIRQYKRLLEDGIITEKDFEAKKAELLGL